MSYKGILVLDEEQMKLQFNFSEPQKVKSIEDDVIYAIFDSIELAVANFGKENVLQALQGKAVETSIELPEKLEQIEPGEIPGYG
ncbi:hypothetical protein [Methanobacterium aggregans]|uniref:hypothetical protein n=1 Tax=Methanobacterium aggregans TaxID=1615586 RepID=UPI001AE57192|nr:hypothetical protein [Methanobacterium aggregans]MBP2045299.1 hypothetical protein [Methanobacterium aggregans]